MILILQSICCKYKYSFLFVSGVYNTWDVRCVQCESTQHTTPSSCQNNCPPCCAACASAGLTQAQLAERLGISQQSYARLEARPAATSVARLSKLLRVLNAELVIHTRDDQPTAVSDEAW